jgi:CheY-like chemotaxis protein
MTPQPAIHKERTALSLPARHSREVPPGRLPDLIMVEDNPYDVDLLHLAMDEMDVRAHVHVVMDAMKTFELIHSLRVIPALIILDINLPLVRGDDLLRRIRSDEKGKNIPVILFTSSNAATDIEECLQLGACAYKTKPDSFEGYLEFAGSLRPFLAARGIQDE